MLKITKNTNYDGIITVEGADVMRCSATVNNGELGYMNQNIVNWKLYSKNNMSVMHDFMEFQTKVMKDISDDKECSSVPKGPSENKDTVDTGTVLPDAETDKGAMEH